MLSKKTEIFLDMVVNDDKIGDEVSARLIDTVPTNKFQADAILRILDVDSNMDKELFDRLSHGFPGDGKLGLKIYSCMKAVGAICLAVSSNKPSPDLGNVEEIQAEEVPMVESAFGDVNCAAEFIKKFNITVKTIRGL